MNKIVILLVLVYIILLTGCRSYPMGLNEKEWNRLSPQKQIELKVRQYEIYEKRRVQRAKERAIKNQLKLEIQRSEQKRLDKIYQNAKYG